MLRTRSSTKLLLLGALVVACALLPAGRVHGLFIKPNLANVPVAQLVQNLEQLVAKNPKDVQAKFNLARVHAMAYAQKVDMVQINNNQLQHGAWFGYTPKAVPFKLEKTDDPAKLMAAKEHLDKALKRYEEVIKDQPTHLAAHLGHAWLVEQSGNKMKAIDEYRKVIETAWDSEGKKKTGPLGGNFITSEAAGYLIPLLDKETNKDEIKTLQDRMDYLQKLPRPITPIAIPLRDGLKPADLLDRAARVRFDADGTGLDQQWTWINKDAAWLVYDPHQRKQISSGLQLFGNVTFWLFWENGYQALGALDDDGDGYLSGPELTGLALWQDLNSDGISQQHEVRTLAQWGITKLSCHYTLTGAGPECQALAPQGVWFADGTVRPTYDLILRQW